MKRRSVLLVAVALLVPAFVHASTTRVRSAPRAETAHDGRHEHARKLGSPSASRSDREAEDILVGTGKNPDGATPNEAQALKRLRRAAAQGNVNAEAVLGAMYYLGRGVGRNYAQALVWLRRAAAGGNVHAEAVLGAMYYRGRDVGRSYA